MKKKAKGIIGGISILLLMGAALAYHERHYIFLSLTEFSPPEEELLEDCLRCKSLGMSFSFENENCSTSFDGYCDCLPAVYSREELKEKDIEIEYTGESVKYCILGIKKKGKK